MTSNLKMAESIDVVIVNWNAGELLRNCVDSLLIHANDREINNIFIVDNASTDNSLSLLPSNNKIQILKNHVNVGFAAACNIGFKKCTAEYVLLLNPDTVLFEDTLIKCKEAMKQDPEIDIMGVQLLTKRGKISKSCARFPSPLRFVFDCTGLSLLYPKIFTPALLMTDWDHKTSRTVDQVMGAFMYFPNSLFQKNGYFDEQFFVYYEELDFCKRLSKIGGKIWFNADIQCRHLGMGTTSKITAFRLFLSIRSRLKYCRKHFSYPGFLIVWLATFLIEPFTRSAYSLIQKKANEIPDIWQAYRWVASGKANFPS